MFYRFNILFISVIGISAKTPYRCNTIRSLTRNLAKGNFSYCKSFDEINFDELLDIFIEKVVIWVY